jgi:hypothetical protein
VGRLTARIELASAVGLVGKEAVILASGISHSAQIGSEALLHGLLLRNSRFLFYHANFTHPSVKSLN